MIKEREGLVDLYFSGKDLSELSVEEIVLKIKKLIGIELPTLSIKPFKNSVQLTFRTIENPQKDKKNTELKNVEW